VNFPLAIIEGEERDAVKDAAGATLMFGAWRSELHLDKSVPISEAEKVADETARETLKELVRMANESLAAFSLTKS